MRLTRVFDFPHEAPASKLAQRAVRHSTVLVWSRLIALGLGIVCLCVLDVATVLWLSVFIVSSVCLMGAGLVAEWGRDKGIVK